MVTRVGILGSLLYGAVTLIDGRLRAFLLFCPFIAGAGSSEMLLTQGALN